MSDGRKRTARMLATVSAAAFSSSLLVAGPVHAMPAPDAPAAPNKPLKKKHHKPKRHKAPKPTIDNTQPRVDKLNHQAEQLSNQFNAARHEMRGAKKRLHHLDARLKHQRTTVADLRGQVASDVTSQYNDQRTKMMADYAQRVQGLRQQRADAQSNLALVTVTKRRLGVEKVGVDRRASKANDLLSQLKERAAQERASRSADRASTSTPEPTSAPASSGAAAAVDFAMAQVGDAYVYGAAGPSAYDCSGLTMAAWQQAGVSLPHSSGAQMGSGTPVSQSELQPGDLVFYYSPVSHVGMYIGNGQIVNAENPSVGVKITGVNSMPYAGAVRPG